MNKRLVAFMLLVATILCFAACTKEAKTVMGSSAVGKKWMEFADSKAAGYSLINRAVWNLGSRGARVYRDDGLNASVIRELQNLEKHLVEDVTESTEVPQESPDSWIMRYYFWMDYSFYVVGFRDEENAVYVGLKDDLCAFCFVQEDSKETVYFRVDCDTDEFAGRLEQIVEEYKRTSTNGSG